MRIAVDLDGVLADTIVSASKILNIRLGRAFTPESFVEWKAWKTAGVTRDEFFGSLDEAWFAWESIPPTEENLDIKVGKLADFGMVDIVTGRSAATVPQANSWLKRYRIPFDSFVRTINNSKAKLTLNYDLYIDDSPELMALVASQLHSFGILYTQPWNKDFEAMPRIFRVERWDEIPKIAERMSSTTVA
jgi:uncharacterized HAD superfamily protein